MPLQKGKVDIYFQSGMAGDTDPRVVPVGSFLSIKNAYVDKRGALVKRNGFQKVATTIFGGGTFSTARSVFSSGDELCVAGNDTLFARDDTSGLWNNRGFISPMTGETEEVFSESAKISARNLDSSANGGYRIHAISYVTSPAAYSVPSATGKCQVDVRIDGDDNNIARERHKLVSATSVPAWESAGSGIAVKTSFCQNGLLVGTWNGATHPTQPGYYFYKYDTTNLAAAPVAFQAVAPVDVANSAFDDKVARPDLCGHTGSFAAGQFSFRYIRAASNDFVVTRYDSSFAVTSTTVFPGSSVGRTYVDGSISDDPTNNRTLVFLVYYEDEEVGGPVKIDVASIDHAGGAVTWQTLIDTLSPTDLIVWNSSALVSPDTFGVSRGADSVGTEIVVAAYSVCQSGNSTELTSGMGQGTNASTNHLVDPSGPNTIPLGTGTSYHGHDGYPIVAVGAPNLGIVPAGPVEQNWGKDNGTVNCFLKWTETRIVGLDATTGVIRSNYTNHVAKNMALVSKPFFNGRNVYAWCKTNLNIGFGYESSVCLDITPEATALPAVFQQPVIVGVKDVGVAVTTAQGTQRVSRGAGNAADRDSLNKVVSSNRITKEALTFTHGELMGRVSLGTIEPAVVCTAMRFNSAVVAARLNDGATVISGASVGWYDSERCTELGWLGPPVFDHWWSNVASTYYLTAGASPLAGWDVTDSDLPLDTLGRTATPTATYKYQSMWKSLDAKGYLHRSLLSPFYAAPTINPSLTSWPPNGSAYFTQAAATDALDCNVVFMKTVPTNRFPEFTQGADHAGSARVYRDFDNNGVFKEVNAENEQCFNKNSAFYISFVDRGQDLTTATQIAHGGGGSPAYNWKLTNPGGELLYTTSGEIENVIPSGAKLAVYANDRVWLAGFYKAERLAYSKKITPQGANLQKVAPEFNEAFVLTTPANAAITGIAAMDDKVVAFTEDHVYVVAGDGPDATGANNTFSALSLVSSDSGCIEPRSTVSFPGGVMFQSERGIHMLGRNLSVQLIGDPIKDILDQYPVITSAVTVPEKTQVRFTATTSNGAEGVVLIYDYRVNQWMYWSVEEAGGVQNVPFVSAAMHKGAYYAIESDGTLWKEDVTKWKDDADSIYYQMNIQTAWLQGAQQSGWQRIYRATALCEQKDTMSLRMRVRNDFNTSTSQAASWDDTVIATFPELPRVQPMVHIKRQQCQAIQLEIYDEQPSGGPGVTTGQGFTIAGFSLEIGIKRGLVKVSKQQRS